MQLMVKGNAHLEGAILDKSTDIIVLMSIMNGELPKTPHNSTDSPYYTVLWRLCQSCWTERACRPSAEEISTLIQTCYDLEVAKLVQVQASDELKRSINNPETYKMEGQAWHLQFEKTFPPALMVQWTCTSVLRSNRGRKGDFCM